METAAMITAILSGIATLAGVLVAMVRLQVELRQIKTEQAVTKQAATAAATTLGPNGGSTLHDAIRRIEKKIDTNHAAAEAEHARLWAAIRRPWWHRTERTAR